MYTVYHVSRILQNLAEQFFVVGIVDRVCNFLFLPNLVRVKMLTITNFFDVLQRGRKKKQQQQQNNNKTMTECYRLKRDAAA
jgi:hypothetical protein